MNNGESNSEKKKFIDFCKHVVYKRHNRIYNYKFELVKTYQNKYRLFYVLNFYNHYIIISAFNEESELIDVLYTYYGTFRIKDFPKIIEKIFDI